MANPGSLARLVSLLVIIMADVGSSALLELSYTYNLDAPTSPKLTPFTYKVLKKGYNDFGVWVELNEFCTSEHSGTHLDAPVHFAKDRWGVSDIPLDRLWRVPGLSKEAATWLATHGQRHGHRTGIVGVGVDTISVDVGNSTRYGAHEAMYSRNLFGLENVANMHKLPPSGFRVTVLPMRIGGGSGAPARIVAELDQRAEPLASASSRNVGASLATLLPVFLPVLIAAVFGKRAA